MGLWSLWAGRWQVYPRDILNAFPVVNYKAVEDYEEPAVNGDQQSETLVLHFAGQYGGARAYDGNTPPLMLIQFYHLLLTQHLRFLQAMTDLNLPAKVPPLPPCLSACLPPSLEALSPEL